MCGIVAYLGDKPAQPILIEGLKRLEYRGYDSAGLAVVECRRLTIHKTAGRIADLERLLAQTAKPEPASVAVRSGGSNGHGVNGQGPASLGGAAVRAGLDLGPRVHVGIAHTRWATHGAPTSVNAHPHTDCAGRIAVVHNGIVENHAALKEYLLGRGHRFASETDTEVLAHLIEEFYQGDLESAVRQALAQVTGAYGIAVLCAEEPGTLVAARNGSPLIVGVGIGEFLAASDAAAIVRHTKQAIYLADREVVGIRPGRLHTGTLDNVEVTKQVEEVELSVEQIEKNGYRHFMLKEIFEQPESLADALAGRADVKNGAVVLGGPAAVAKELVRARRIILIGCGSAYHAGLIGEYLMEELARIPVETEYAGEFRGRNPIIEDGTVVTAISQSGETADTLAALREAKLKGALCLGIVNVVGSTIAREVDAGVYLKAGPEIGVAATKSFTSQAAVCALMGIFLGRRRHLSPAAAASVLEELIGIPDKIRSILEQSDHIRGIAARLVERKDWLYLGRGYNFPVALEGALKLKEIAYLHAEGLAASEMKHGPIALVTEGMPVVAVVPTGVQYEKMLSNIEEVRCRGGHIVAIATEGDRRLAGKAAEVVYIPPTIDCLQPLLTVIPLQLLAYHAAVLLGRDVDKPRNLAKSVTVE